MLENIFLQLLNMSLTASFIIFAVLVVRLFLRKAPKVFSYALWAVVLFRLVCPFSFESVFSLMPVNPTPVAPDILYAQAPKITTGLTAIDQAASASLPMPTVDASVNPLQIWAFVGTVLWILGIATMLIYSLISLMKLKRCLRGAVLEGGNVYLSDRIPTPFVLGLIRPKIYLPAILEDHEKLYILLHEQTHIRRLDPIVKIISFFVLCLHWFNPLVWAAFFLLSKDMEMSCDEAVIKKLGSDVKKEYSSSLLTLATGRRLIGATPLAFGEGDTKGRIKHVLHYKKPAFWVIIAALVAILLAAAALISNPLTKYMENTIYTEKISEDDKISILEQSNFGLGLSTVIPTNFCVDETIKSMRYYVEVYRYGELLGVVADSYGNLQTRQGRITTVFKINNEADGRWTSVEWALGLNDGGYAVFPNIQFPDDFAPNGAATSTLANEFDQVIPYTIAAEKPIILACVAFQEVNSRLISYDCKYLMENPGAIGEYEYALVLKCLFSEKDENSFDISTAYKNRTVYVGDNAKVGGIISELSFPQNVVLNGFELKAYDITSQ